MSHWRPIDSAIFCIADIHGNIDLLEKICNRILPLRKSEGELDTLVLLGDYIDRHVDGHKVIDFCIDLKKQYGDQVVCLMGNHELMLLDALNMRPNKNISLQGMSHTYKMWCENGGYDTIAGYMARAGELEGWGSLPRQRVSSFIPKEHIEFFQSLKPYHQIDDFVFVHGGYNPQEDVSKHEIDVLVWDRSLVKFVLNAIENEQELPWEKIVVCGHTPQSDKNPIVKPNFFMLDCGAPKQLLVAEMRTQTAYMAAPDKDRLVKFDLSETCKKEKRPGMIRRIS